MRCCRQPRWSGVRFWPAALAAATGVQGAAVERALHRLEQRDLVEEQPVSTMAGQTEYRFRHVLVRDVCYQRLPRGARVSLHQRTADWLERIGEGRQAELAEVLAHHRWTAHEIARTLGLDPAPHAPAARAALHRAARRAYALNALDTANTMLDRALGLKLPTDPGLELFAAELSLYRDGDGFLADGGPSQLADLTGELARAGDRAGAARAWTLLAIAAWSRADHDEAVRCLDEATGIYADLPDSEEKTSALLELARVHYINGETPPAIEAASAAAEMADRLGLVEARASARITLAAACYLSGASGGLEQLVEITEHCRVHRLASRRRAVQNLAWARQEEGDLAVSRRLVEEHRSLEHGGGHGLATTFVDRFARAYYAGDWAESVAAATASLSRPTAEWDLHVVAISAWLQVLRAGPDPEDDLQHVVSAGRRSGFHRVLRSALAHAALCRALQGRRAEAHQLLVELAEDWRQAATLAFSEWAAGAAHAAALLGGESADLVRGVLEQSSRRTPWVLAALDTVAVAAPDDPAAHHIRAARRYGDIGAETDRALAWAAAARELRGTDEPGRRAEVIEPLEAFAARNSAPGLLPGG